MNLPEPIFFGAGERPSFGWLHRPGGAAAALGLVICSPFGFEEVCAHRALRTLAEAVASRAGMAVLRYDLPGCGNSAGDVFDGASPTAWIASVHDAVQALRDASGAPRVALLGVRLGALLAWAAGAQRDDVAGLIAIAPVVRGRQYVRELRLLGEAARPGAAGRADVIESAGFMLAEPAAAELSAIDLHSLSRPPAAQVVVVERDDLVVQEDWAGWGTRLGIDLRVERWPGFAALMTDPQRAQVPQAIVDGVLGTLRTWRGREARPSASGRSMPRRDRRDAHVVADVHPPVRETPVWIDEAGRPPLFGMLATPAAGAVSAGIVMLNAGSVHHIGPNRLWVLLSRRWAARGCAVLRLDLRGLGDSPALPAEADNQFYPPRALDDVAAALPWLRQRTGVSEVHLLGLCSGGFHAFKAAVAGLQVSSATAVNPLTFFWRSGMQIDVDLTESESIKLTRRYRSRLRDTTTWRRLLRGQLDLPMIGRAVALRLWSALKHRAGEVGRQLAWTPREDLATELLRVADSPVALRFVFSVGEPGLELLRAQGGHVVAELHEQGRIVIELVEDADHTFTRLEARDRLVALLDRMMFEPGAATPQRPAPSPALTRGRRAA